MKGRRIVHILLFGDAATDPEFQCGIVRSLRERLPAGHHLASLVHRCTLLQGTTLKNYFLNRYKNYYLYPDKTRRGGRVVRPLVPAGNGYSLLNYVY